VPQPRFERTVLLSPDAVARQAARLADDPEVRWILSQPRAVRRSFVAEVLPADELRSLREQIWMLRQDSATRESFVREVLGPRLRGSGPAAGDR
jgi:hypothetical protein